MRSNLSGVRLLVYDLDGTLLDAFRKIWRCADAAFSEARLPVPSFDEVKSSVGDGSRVLIRRLLKSRAPDRFDSVFERFMAHYTSNPASDATLYPDVIDTLRLLRGRSFTQCILTNKPEEVTLPACQTLGLTKWLDGIWGGLPNRPLKPHPDSLNTVLAHFKRAPGECAMIGDYRADYEVAAATGARMIGVTWGLFSREETLKQNPDAIIDSMKQLPALLSAES